ncbi:MAG: chain-length determining protein [Prevotella sp.]|nr:chain-length determining protein [Prevotella sp.]
MEEKKKIIDIHLIEVAKMLRADFKMIRNYMLAAGLVGVILAFATPKIYKSTVILAPEESGSSFSGSISSLAAMVGMNMKIGQTGDALYPEIYPDIMESTGFIVGMFSVPVKKNKTGETYTYFDYLDKHQRMAFYEYPMDWLGKLRDLFNDPVPADHKVNPKQLTKKENDIAKMIKGNMDCTVDKKTSVITIVVEDQDPLIAATIADSTQMHLQHTITDYRTKKARIDLDYMEQLFTEAHKEYDAARKKFATFSDANSKVVLPTVQSELDNLEADMQLKYNIYQQVVEQRQLALAKVQERTPAFTIIQEATVPVKHSNLPKVVTLAIWMILGFLVRFSMLALKNRSLFLNI